MKKIVFIFFLILLACGEGPELINSSPDESARILTCTCVSNCPTGSFGPVSGSITVNIPEVEKTFIVNTAGTSYRTDAWASYKIENSGSASWKVAIMSQLKPGVWVTHTVPAGTHIIIQRHSIMPPEPIPCNYMGSFPQLTMKFTRLTCGTFGDNNFNMTVKLWAVSNGHSANQLPMGVHDDLYQCPPGF